MLGHCPTRATLTPANPLRSSTPCPQLRTEHRAARAAAGLPEDSEGELDDDYYPPSLPPWCARAPPPLQARAAGQGCCRCFPAPACTRTLGPLAPHPPPNPLRSHPSILANKEPFKGGEWRKTPYIPR